MGVDEAARRPLRGALWEALREGFSLISLHETRRFLRRSRTRFLIAPLAASYALISMLVGFMLEFFPTHDAFSTTLIFDYVDPSWWNYPGLLVIWPGGVLALPFLSTVTMVVDSVAVGVGGATALTVLWKVIRSRRQPGTARSAAGVMGGVTPSITGLATLGACCCTSCVGLAGVVAIAAVSGANVLTLQVNSWYVDFFQMGVIGIALLSQERALRSEAGSCVERPKPRYFRMGIGLAFRLALLIGGITWFLAMFLEMGTASLAGASPAQWYHWIFEHGFLSILAIAAGLFPRRVVEGVQRWRTNSHAKFFRLALGAVGASWALYVPPSLASLGLGGLLNEVMGYLGAPGSWGAIAPDGSLGLALAFHWVVQHALLGGFALSLAIVPEYAILPLAWSDGGPREVATRPSTVSSFVAPPKEFV